MIPISSVVLISAIGYLAYWLLELLFNRKMEIMATTAEPVSTAKDT